MKHLLIILAVLALAVPAMAATPIADMVGANYTFRASGDLCSATLFDRAERWVLTNHHCIESATRIIEQDDVQADGTVRKVRRVFYDEVTLSQPAYGPDGRVGELTLRARVLAFSKQKDLAVLQVLSETTALPGSAKIPPDDYRLQQGQVVYAIGNPAGMDNTLTRGIVSHLYREHRWGPDQVARYIQTDATIIGGSSGGALYDEEGLLIGVPAAGYRGAQINFAIPIFEVKTFLRDNGFARAWDPKAPTRAEWLEEQKRKAKEREKPEGK